MQWLELLDWGSHVQADILNSPQSVGYSEESVPYCIYYTKASYRGLFRIAVQMM